MAKNWNKLKQNEKNYWLLLYQGQAKLSGQQDIPKAYLKPIMELEKKREKQRIRKKTLFLVMPITLAYEFKGNYNRDLIDLDRRTILSESFSRRAFIRHP